MVANETTFKTPSVDLKCLALSHVSDLCLIVNEIILFQEIILLVRTEIEDLLVNHLEEITLPKKYLGKVLEQHKLLEQYVEQHKVVLTKQYFGYSFSPLKNCLNKQSDYKSTCPFLLNAELLTSKKRLVFNLMCNNKHPKYAHFFLWISFILCLNSIFFPERHRKRQVFIQIPVCIDTMHWKKGQRVSSFNVYSKV